MTSLAAKVASLEAQVSELQAEIDKITTSPIYKTEVEFRDKVKALMGEYGMSLNNVVNLIEPKAPAASKTVKGNARLTMTYKNPHTQEVVETKGMNHRTLREWREKWGKVEVAGWLIN